jgi:hypothetical protein
MRLHANAALSLTQRRRMAVCRLDRLDPDRRRAPPPDGSSGTGDAAFEA